MRGDIGDRVIGDRVNTTSEPIGVTDSPMPPGRGEGL
jgi:hypothetical protein